MKILKYITAVFALLFVASSCEKEVTNPVIEDTDYRVYFYGSGENAYNVAREGFDIMLGESLEVKLMTNRAEEVKVKWVESSDSTLINETLDYTFAPTVEGLQKKWFVSTLPSGLTDTVVFNFRGVTDGIVRDAVSEMAVWQNFEYPQGVINGSFTAEFDMVAEKNNTNCITGFQSGEAAGFGDLSAILRFTTAGNFDARNGGSYTFDNEVKYSAGLTYHVRMEINSLEMMYDVFITDADGNETQLADDYAFRKQVSTLSHWSVIADAWQTAPENQGSHTISNMEISNVKQNVNPIFSPIDDIVMEEGDKTSITVRAKDPSGGVVSLTAGDDLPRFIKFIDNGNGSASLDIEPYFACGGCDVGTHVVTIFAKNAEGTSETSFSVTVAPLEEISVVVDIADATIFESGSTQLNPNHTSIDIGAANYGTPTQMNAVMPFALPTIPEGKVLVAAYLKVSVEFNNASWGAKPSYDVYALDARTSSEVLYTDFYKGTYGGDDSATAIQEGFYADGDPLGEYIVSNGAAKDMASFINQQFENAVTPGQFVFLRVNSSVDNPTWVQSKISAYETSDEANRSQLVLLLKSI